MNRRKNYKAIFFLGLAFQAAAVDAMSQSMIEYGKEAFSYLKNGDSTGAKLCRASLCVGGLAGALYVFKETKFSNKVAEKSLAFTHRFPNTSAGIKCTVQAVGLFAALKIAYPGMTTSEQTFGLAQAFTKGIIEAGARHAGKCVFEAALASNNDNHEVTTNKITFADIAGGPPKAIKDFMFQLKHADRRARYGLGSAKGFLFYGPPGTGKTLLAQAVAGEMENCRFFYASGAEFVNQYVGKGPATVRALFEQAQNSVLEGRSKSALIFIDEIDAIGRRSDGTSGGLASKEYDNTINQFLTLLDGVNSCPGIFVIGATNRRDLIDDAIVRAGRLGSHIEIPLPDLSVRKALFEHYLSTKFAGVQKSNDIDTELLARDTAGANAADIAGIVAGAAGLAVNEAIELEESGGVSREPIIRQEFFRRVMLSLPASALHQVQVDSDNSEED